MNELPKSVTKRLAKPDGPLLVHPDADLLTAFLEQKTTRSEREQVFAHLSQCSGCREVVAFAAPERIAASTAPVMARGERRWLQWPGMRWAAVAAGSVIVAAIGIALRPTLSERSVSQPATEVVLQKEKAPAPLADKIGPSETATTTRATDSKKESAPASQMKRSELEARNEIGTLKGMVPGALVSRKIAPSTKPALEKDAQAATPAEETKQSAKLNQTVEVTAQAANIAAASPPVSRPTGGRFAGGTGASTPRADRDQVIPNQTLDANGNQQRKFVIQPQQAPTQGLARVQQPTDAFTTSAPAPPSAASSSASTSTDAATSAEVTVNRESKDKGGIGGLTLERGRTGRSKAVLPNLGAVGFGGAYHAAASPALKSSAGEAVSWKISPEGKLLRKGSDEDSWHAIELPTAATLHSLASNNLDVWVGGAPLSAESSGALFHTTDGGEHWQRVNGPWTGDILALQASGAHNSVLVRTAGGEWQSQDAGVNWIRTR